MKKIIAMLLVLMLLVTSCGIYANGKTYGYVTTVESGFFWDRAWVRAELESSQTDCYVIDESIKYDLEKIAETKQRVELTYRRHFFTMSLDCLNDEIYKFRVLD